MKAALIGLGMVSGTYGDAFRNSNTVQLAKVYARSPENRRAFLDRWPDLGAVAAESVEEIAASDVDFVILTTPPNARAKIVATLAAAGKSILMEKPVERSLAQATALVETCETAGVSLGIVLQHRARPVVSDLRAHMPTLGTLHAVEVSIPWWRDQSYYDEPGRGTYARDGGGVLISQAIHTLDLMLTLTGPASRVTAMTATTGLHQMEAEDFVSAGLQFANGAVGQLFATTASFPGRGETITMHFSEGSVLLDAGVLRIDRRNGTCEVVGQAVTSGAGADPMAFSSDWHRTMIEDFAQSVADGRPPIVSGREALEVHRLISALETSARVGAPINMKDI